MPFIHLKTNLLEYKFEFSQKYLFIRGDSAGGKTSLIDVVNGFANNPESVKCLGDSNLRVLDDELSLQREGYVFFLDENNPILYRGNAASLFNNSNNYFVIINRTQRFDHLKTGLDSLVRMVSTGSFHTVECIYPRKEHLEALGEIVVCEDSGSGKQFLEKITGQQVEAAASKDKIAIKLRKLGNKEYTLVYDRCGVSFSYEEQMRYLQNRGIHVVSEIDWDSFESYILESKDYGVSVPWYPDKEANAVQLFKEIIDPTYNKNSLPEGMKLPVYGKCKELTEITNQQLKDMEVL